MTVTGKVQKFCMREFGRSPEFRLTDAAAAKTA
jgi:hypothetical protein